MPPTGSTTACRQPGQDHHRHHLECHAHHVSDPGPFGRPRLRSHRQASRPRHRSQQLALDPHVPPPRFSRAIRTTKVARTSLIGGRPVRFR